MGSRISADIFKKVCRPWFGIFAGHKSPSTSVIPTTYVSYVVVAGPHASGYRIHVVIPKFKPIAVCSTLTCNRSCMGSRLGPEL
jgi:hypothetical protein